MSSANSSGMSTIHVHPYFANLMNRVLIGGSVLSRLIDHPTYKNSETFVLVCTSIQENDRLLPWQHITADKRPSTTRVCDNWSLLLCRNKMRPIMMSCDCNVSHGLGGGYTSPHMRPTTTKIWDDAKRLSYVEYRMRLYGPRCLLIPLPNYGSPKLLFEGHFGRPACETFSRVLKGAWGR